MNLFFSTVLALPLLGTLGHAQITLWVGPGSGEYRSIQAAVNGAHVGDIIRVKRSTAGYAGATVRKGLHLLAEGSISITTPITIQNVGLGQHVAIKGFRLRLNENYAANVVIRNCRGTVHLADVHSRGSRYGHGLEVQNCAHVSATDCTFNSGVYVHPFFRRISYTGPGVSIDASHALFTRCHLKGSAYVSMDSRQRFLASYEGARVTASRIVLVDCEVTGGAGQCVPVFGNCAPFQSPKPAIRADLGSTIVAKGSSILGSNHGVGQCSCSATKAGDLVSDSATRVLRDPGKPFTVQGGQVVIQNVHDLQAAGAAPGQTVPVTLRSGTVAPFAVLCNHPAPATTPNIGIWLSLANPAILYADFLQGTHTENVATPRNLPRGIPIALQAALLVRGRLELSTPVVVVSH